MSGEAFTLLSEGDLKELGFKMGERKLVLSLIGSMKNGSGAGRGGSATANTSTKASFA